MNPPDPAGHSSGSVVNGPHNVLLLAAGGSRRLGQPKQLLRINGQALVRHMLECALATRPAKVFVVVGAESAAVTTALSGLDKVPLHYIENANWPSGLASSLQAAAPALLAAGLPVLILGCDQIRLTPVRLQALLDISRSVSAPNTASFFDTADTVTVCDYGTAVGLPVLVPVTLFRRVAELKADQGLKALWQGLPMQRLSAPELGFDLDTTDDLALARRHGWLDAENR